MQSRRSDDLPPVPSQKSESRTGNLRNISTLQLGEEEGAKAKRGRTTDGWRGKLKIRE